MMSGSIRENAGERVPLSRDRVLRCAAGIAGETGIGSLTIRSLAEALGVKPMTVYHYVANKDEILDGIVDLVFSEIELPSTDGPWRPELQRWANSARQVLRRDAWAIALLQRCGTTTGSSACSVGEDSQSR